MHNSELSAKEIFDCGYERLDGRTFGVMQFTRKPIAAPPTLTLFVNHKAIDLEAQDPGSHTRDRRRPSDDQRDADQAL